MPSQVQDFVLEYFADLARSGTYTLVPLRDLVKLYATKNGIEVSRHLSYSFRRAAHNLSWREEVNVFDMRLPTWLDSSRQPRAFRWQLVVAPGWLAHYEASDKEMALENMINSIESDESLKQIQAILDGSEWKGVNFLGSVNEMQQRIAENLLRDGGTARTTVDEENE